MNGGHSMRRKVDMTAHQTEVWAEIACLIEMEVMLDRVRAQFELLHEEGSLRKMALIRFAS
jgi:hypothetical protein